MPRSLARRPAALCRCRCSAACSGSSEDDVRARRRRTFLDDWSGGKHRPPRRRPPPTPRAATALLEQTADGPARTPTLSAKLGQGRRQGRRRPPSPGPRPGTSRPPPTGRYDATLTLREGDDGWQVVAEPDGRAPASWGRGSTWCSPAACADRAPITDATGAPLFTADRGGQRRRRPGQGHRPARPGRRRSRRPPASPPTRSPPTCRRPKPGQFVPVITLRRPDFEAIRAQVFDLPGAVFPTSHPAARAHLPLRAGAARPGRRRPPPRCIDETKDDGQPPLRRRRPARACPGCSGPSRQQLAGTAGLHGHRGEHRQEHRRRRAQIAASPRCPARRCRRRWSPRCRTPPTRPSPASTLPTHLVVVRPGHRRDPRRLLERGRRPRQRADRPASRPARA